MGVENILDKYKLFDIDLYKLRSENFHAEMIRDRNVLLARHSACLKKDGDFICPLCGSEEKEFFIAYRNYTLFECLDCGAVAPNIDHEELSKANIHGSKLIEEDFKREILSTFDYRKETFATERVAYLRDIIDGFGEASTKVLDVGCGPGYFLSYLKDIGINGRGLEVNDYCASFCQEHGLDVDNVELSCEPESEYSLITMFDVLEHLSDPIKVFRSASSKLRSGGQVLAYTPNIHSMGIHLLGGEHNMISVFNHLCLYSRGSLERLAKETGFAVVNIDYYGLDIMDYLAMKESQDNWRYFSYLRKMTSAVQAVIDSSELGNSMRVLFKKDS